MRFDVVNLRTEQTEQSHEGLKGGWGGRMMNEF